MSLLEDTPLHVLGYATVAVEKAARRGEILAVDAAAMRLLERFPNCDMSFAEIRERIIMFAAKRGVAMDLDSEPGS